MSQLTKHVTSVEIESASYLPALWTIILLSSLSNIRTYLERVYFRIKPYL
jgi:hypothetical protein